VDGGDDRLGKGGELVELLLHVAGELFRVVGNGQLLQKIDLRSGDEVVLLARGEHHRLGGRILAGAGEQPFELGAALRRKRVHRFVLLVEGDHRHATVQLVGKGSLGLHCFDFDCHLGALQDDCCAEPAGGAHRAQRGAEVAPVELAKRLHHHARAGGPEGMAERDGSTVDI